MESVKLSVQTDHRLFDARVKILSPRHQCENPFTPPHVTFSPSFRRRGGKEGQEDGVLPVFLRGEER